MTLAYLIVYTFSFIVFFWIFPSRAAQKLNLSSKKKKHRPSTSSVAEPPLFATSFSGILQTSPPPAPPCLLRAVNKVKDTPGLGKVGTCAVCHAGSVYGVLHQRQGREWGLGLFAKTRRWQGEKEKKWKSFGSTVKFSLVTYTSSQLRHSNYWRCGLILAERKEPCIVWQNCTQLKKRPHNTKDRGRGRRDQETQYRNKTWKMLRHFPGTISLFLPFREITSSTFEPDHWWDFWGAFSVCHSSQEMQFWIVTTT